MTNITSLTSKLPANAVGHLEKANINLGVPETDNFGERMSDAVKSVANAQTESAQMTKNYELGLETDLSKVMVQQQVSSLGFQLTLNVRNKILSAYKDIMNMPV